MTGSESDFRGNFFIGIPETKLRDILANLAFGFIVIGGFLGIVLIFLASPYKMSWLSVTLLWVALALIAFHLFDFWKTRRILVRARKFSRDAAWLLSQMTPLKIAMFIIIGALFSASVVFIAVVLNDLFKLKNGVVPHLTVLGSNIYLTAAFGVLLLFIGHLGSKSAARLWASRKVREKRLEP